MTLKEKIYQHYVLLMNEKIKNMQQVLADLKESGANETKSTAGDKHDTALAMLQIEQANVRAQLKDALEQKAILEKINPLLKPEIIVPGCLVKTNRGYLFISVALGKAVVESIPVIALSPQSPLGKKLMGQQAGCTIEVNHTQYLVENIS